MHTSIKILKNSQKKLALEIKELKNQIKTLQKERGSGAACIQQGEVVSLKRTYRHRHIAYCLLRGRQYEQIESRRREGNEPDWNLIQEVKDEYASKDVCTSAS
jgi:hypothetical protein